MVGRGVAIRIGVEDGVTGDSVAGGVAVADGKVIGEEESSRVAHAARNKTAIMHGMKYLLSFFMVWLLSLVLN